MWIWRMRYRWFSCLSDHRVVQCFFDIWKEKEESRHSLIFLCTVIFFFFLLNGSLIILVLGNIFRIEWKDKNEKKRPSKQLKSFFLRSRIVILLVFDVIVYFDFFAFNPENISLFIHEHTSFIGLKNYCLLVSWPFLLLLSLLLLYFTRASLIQISFVRLLMEYRFICIRFVWYEEEQWCVHLLSAGQTEFNYENEEKKKCWITPSVVSNF